MPELIMVVPSRGRPVEAADLAATCEKTATADTRLLFAVDTDDPTINEYGSALAPFPTTDIYLVAPRGHVGALNEGAEYALHVEPFALGKLDDDHRPRTLGWDAKMVDALRGLRTGIVYGDDLLQGQRLPTAPALTADIVRTLGYMAPYELRHMFNDDFWRDLGQRARCLRYLPDVVIEHMHPLAGKAEWDEGHLRVNDPGRMLDDQLAYRRYQAQRFDKDVDKVLALRGVLASES